MLDGLLIFGFENYLNVFEFLVFYDDLKEDGK